MLLSQCFKFKQCMTKNILYIKILESSYIDLEKQAAFTVYITIIIITITNLNFAVDILALDACLVIPISSWYAKGGYY